MDLGIADKVAVVTGGSRGIGKAVAEALGQEGCRVAVIARDPEVLSEAVGKMLADGIDATGYAADLIDHARVTAAFASIRADLGAPGILIYNNGGARDVNFEDASDEDFLHAYQVLVMGFTWCMREVLPDMRSQGWGRIVTIGSLCVKEPHKEFPMVLHNLGRPAQVGMSKTLANQEGKFGITVNTIATGVVDHDGGSAQRSYAKAAAARGMTMEEVQQFRTGNVPAGRAGTAQELAAVCAFLCSQPASYVNGQTILVDGGRVASLM